MIYPFVQPFGVTRARVCHAFRPAVHVPRDFPSRRGRRSRRRADLDLPFGTPSGIAFPRDNYRADSSGSGRAPDPRRPTVPAEKLASEYCIGSSDFCCLRTPRRHQQFRSDAVRNTRVGSSNGAYGTQESRIGVQSACIFCGAKRFRRTGTGLRTGSGTLRNICAAVSSRSRNLCTD